MFFGEYRPDRPRGTRVRVAHGDRPSENYWVMESPVELIETVGLDPSEFLAVHLPTGGTPSDLEDDPSVEVVPVWINRTFIEMIGPSPVLHTKRRRLGKIYTTDGLDLQLYESLSRLRELAGDQVPETEEKYRP